jgi:hypothetical protein
MGIFDAFKQMDQFNSFTEGSWDPTTHEPQYQDSSKIQEYYSMYKLTQPSYAIDGYISPYPTNNWDTSSGILSYVEDTTRLPALDQRIDPNKIFNSDIAALRALASDQNKIVKMFEKRLTESLTDKGKFGVNEDDINAMQAVTAGRNAIVGITKEQINIKKNIADIRLKQQQQTNAVQSSVSGSTGPSGIEMGKSFMDRIFDMPARQAATDIQYSAPSMSIEQASSVIDDLIPKDIVDSTVAYESMSPKTYVVVGEHDDDAEFVTYDSSGNIIPDYPNPTSHIESIDRENGKATDDLLQQYDVKFKN